MVDFFFFATLALTGEEISSVPENKYKKNCVCSNLEKVFIVEMGV